MSQGDAATCSQTLQRNVISVVVPVRNGAASIGTLLRSLLPDRELIREILLVDDGSEDATAEMAQEAAQRHNLPLLVRRVACGSAGAARNAGMAQAQGQFLFFVDGDDELVPGALTILATTLVKNPKAGLAIGACIRQTTGRPDKIKCPHGYTDDCKLNAVRYLANELWPIAMGSALVAASATAGIRFPAVIGIDEDTCYWAAVLARVRIVTTAEPILIYKHDEARMARRFTLSPRKTLLSVARTFRTLSAYGIPEAAVKRRIAWVALRMARQLIMSRWYAEADGILRLVRKHPVFHASWTVFRYDCRIKAGSTFQRFGWCKPPAVRGKLDDLNGRRILIVTLDDASTPVSGADLRNYQNALFSSKLGRARMVSIRPGSPETAGQKPGLEFFSVGVPGEKSGSLSSWRCSIQARISRACLPRLFKIIQDFQPDTIIVEGVPLAALLKHLRPLVKLLILDMHNIESSLASNRPARLSSIFKNDVVRVRRLERRAIKSVDRIWVCSEPDRDRLLKLHQPDAPIYIVPNGIPRFDEPNNMGRSYFHEGMGGPVLLFIGHLGYWPNVVAVERLVRGIFPKVKETFPSAKVVLAGRHPSPVVRAIAALPGVELHANPGSLVKFYERAHIAVVPLSAGGGTRIKILEAVAARLPVVATTVAVEGLGLVENEEVLLADSDEGLARHIIDLCQNPERILRQTLFAEKAVKVRFSPEAVGLAVRRAAS